MLRFGPRAFATVFLLIASVVWVARNVPSPLAQAEPASSTSSVNGIGTYIGGSPQTGTFNLPLVRTDGFDTIIHIANAATASTNLNVTFYNLDGTVNSTRITGLAGSLGTWAETDIDVGSVLGSGFNGSATISASPNPIAVSVDVISSANNDNVDSYTPVVGGSTNGFVSFAPNGGNGFVGTVYLQNTSSSPTSATITYWGKGNQFENSFNVNLNGFGRTSFSPNGVSFSTPGFAGQVQIQSGQPIAAVTDLTNLSVLGSSTNTYGVSPSSTSTSNTTFFVPRFEYQSNNWNNALIVVNTNASGSGTSDTFTATFYNPDGSQATTVTSDSIAPQASWNVNLISTSTLSLPAGFVGSAMITSTGSAVAMVAKVQGSTTSPSALSSYAPLSAAPSGPWEEVPGLRQNASNGTETGSTAFTLFNADTKAQDYQIVYWNGNGSQVKTDSLSLPPNGSFYYDQKTDSGLPNGFEGSAQIINVSGGHLPLVEVEFDAGTFTPPGSSGAAPTPFPTVCPATPTPAATPTQVPGTTAEVYLPFVNNSYTAGGC